MKNLVVIAFFCTINWSYGLAKPDGVGAFAYQDSTGNRAFAKNAEHQKIALDAARKAFDLTSNQAGYIPNSGYENRFGEVPQFGAPAFDFPFYDFGMAGFGNPFRQGFGQGLGNMENSAFAAGFVAPGFRQQMAAINPPNPEMPNVDVKEFSEQSPKANPNGNFYSVSSTSFSSSSNINGHKTNKQVAETIVNDNGKTTKYSVHN